jgi:hypothetical protein
VQIKEENGKKVKSKKKEKRRRREKGDKQRKMQTGKRKKNFKTHFSLNRFMFKLLTFH